MNSPLVSIITPAYNASRFIGETIHSVQRQTYTNWELIIINDSSNDGTAQVVERFMRQDKRIKLIVLPRNVGAAKARNIGIKQAAGEFIAFLDSDDIWLPEKLHVQVTFMVEKNISFSFTGYTIVNESGGNTGVEIHAPAIVDYYVLTGNTIIGCLTVMLDRRKLGVIQMPNMQPEDTALWLLLLRQGHKAYGIPRILAQYRVVEGSVSRNKVKAAKRYWAVLRKQEKMSIVQSSRCLIQYALNAYMKNKKGYGV